MELPKFNFFLEGTYLNAFSIKNGGTGAFLFSFVAHITSSIQYSNLWDKESVLF